MTEIEIIRDEIERVKSKYLTSALDIISDFATENKTKNDYRGRQIFELMQNADDCYDDKNQEIKIKFQLEGSRLIVQNSGKAFSARGIASLMHTDASSKIESDTIGCKGLGFRSVLNWANEIDIYTNEFHANFSLKEAYAKLNYYKENCTDKININELDRIDRIAILNAASVDFNEEEIKKYLDDGFATSIVLSCNEDCVDTIQQQLIDLQFEELLFLKHVSTVEILSQKCNRTIRSTKNSNIHTILDGDLSSEWKVWRKDGFIEKDGKEKKYEIALAYNLDKEEREKIRQSGQLYSYFKTDIPMYFPFLIHATFELSSERNTLIKDDESNKKLISILIDFIAERGCALANENHECNYEVLRFLIPLRRQEFLDQYYNFNQLLKDRIKDFNVFPTINEKYISLNGNPKYSNNRWDKYLNKNTCFNLLKHCEDQAIYEYLIGQNIPFYKDTELVDLINIDADEYVRNHTNIELVKLYQKEYYGTSKVAAEILVDNEDNRIIGGDKKIFYNPEHPFVLPNWSKMCFLNINIEKTLKSAWDCSARVMADKLQYYGCEEYSFDKVLKELINQSKNNIDNTRDLIVWLFDVWVKNNNQFPTALTNVDIKILDRDNNIISCSIAYFGKEYKNDIGEKLISFIPNHFFIASIKDLGLEGKDFNIVINFLKQLGVKFFPKIEQGRLLASEMDEYRVYNSQMFPKLIAENNEVYTIEELQYSESAITVDKIDCIAEILTKCDFEDIVYWLIKDSSLYEIVTSETELNVNSSISGRPISKINKRSVGASQMRSYLRKIFQETNWISTTTGERVGISNCTLKENNLYPILKLIKVDYDKLYKMFKKNNKKELESLFEKLGIAETVVDLPKEKIYEVLIKLPDLENAILIAKKIYTQINLQFDADDANILIANNKNYEIFKNTGRVLAEINGEYSFIPVNEVFYVGKKVYSDDILSGYPKLVLNKRAGDEKVQKIFCTKPIRSILNIKVTNHVEHDLNNAYQEEFKKILPYLYAKRIEVDHKNKELGILKNSKICLVRSIETECIVGDTKLIGNMKDFELIYTDKVAYIKVPQNIQTIYALKEHTLFKSAVAEVLTTMLDIDGFKDSFMNILSCKSISEIEEYFKTNGDDTLSIVNEAKEKFDSQINYEEEFYKAIQMALKDKGDNKNIPIDFNAGDLDYQDLSKDSNIPIIKELFISLDIDIQDYNKFAYNTINISPYYKNLFHELHRNYRKKYLTYLAKTILESNGSKKTFEGKKAFYDFYQLLDVENSIHYDVRQTFEDVFQIKCEELDKYGDGFENYQKDLREETVVQNDYKNENQEEFYVDYVKRNEEILKNTTSQSLKPTISPLNNEMTGVTQSKGGGQSYGQKTNKIKDYDGFIAESKVYWTLKSRIGKEGTVGWASGNAEKARVVDRGDDSLGYDMWYSDEKGVTYVEVKGGLSKNIEFSLTKNEIDFAQNHKDNYEIWFVHIDNGEPTTPYELGNLFKFEDNETFLNNNKFSVEQGEFKIRAKIDDIGC